MRLKLLGTAAGGGFPQWNCSCANCSRVRSGGFKFKPRTQSQVAVTPDGERWILLNASPDLRTQIESFEDLHPKKNSNSRHSPIDTIILTNPDLDHVLGLLLLRELQQLHVYGAPSVKKILFKDNSMFGMLQRKTDQILWTDLFSGTEVDILFKDGKKSGLKCQAISLSSRFPMYVQLKGAEDLNPSEAVFGLKITDTKTGKSFLHMPGVGQVDPKLLSLMNETDLILFDGTFWTEDELKKIDPSAKQAKEMGHIPQSGPSGSLALLSSLSRPKKVFMHINNTNPILDEESEEHHAVLKAGWLVGYDGMEFEL